MSAAGNTADCDLGMIGLGVMGRNLVLNMADHGYNVAGFDRNTDAVSHMRTEGAGKSVRAADTLAEMIGMLKRPRAVMMLVPAGKPVDAVIQGLLPLLQPGDVIVDGGNSHFIDTDRRIAELATSKIHFLGVGISGGESGARNGPSIMPGGPKEGYEPVRSIFDAVAAKFNGQPCSTYLGPGSAGHYVKMVHNGIEYGLLSLISEAYQMMKECLKLNNDELHAVFSEWSKAELNGYLMEITAKIFTVHDPDTGKFLVDLILDQAHQKGTGLWTAQDALELQVPVPTLAIAVTMRDLSGMKAERVAASKTLPGPSPAASEDRKVFIERLRRAMHAAMVITYAQGMAQLRIASGVHNYALNMDEVASIWRAGCIIRSALLEDMRAAYKSQPDLVNLLLDPNLAKIVVSKQADLRWAVQTAAGAGVPGAALMTSLLYFDAYRSENLPANLIQAQRDCFGAHTYERIDRPGSFHTEWED